MHVFPKVQSCYVSMTSLVDKFHNIVLVLGLWIPVVQDRGVEVEQTELLRNQNNTERRMKWH